MRGGQCYYNNQNKLLIYNTTEIGGKHAKRVKGAICHGEMRGDSLKIIARL